MSSGIGILLEEETPYGMDVLSSRTEVSKERPSTMGVTAVIVIGGMFHVVGTSPADSMQIWDKHYEYAQSIISTGAGLLENPAPVSELTASHPSVSTSHTLSELRRISGLTWDQLAQTFKVSRRSLHFWASGKKLSAQNEERLMRVHAVICTGKRGDARLTRSALVAVVNGTTAIELLGQQRFAEAGVLLGQGVHSSKSAAHGLSVEAQAERKPPSPETLWDAKQDRVHRSLGKGRAAKSVRNRRRGGS